MSKVDIEFMDHYAAMAKMLQNGGLLMVTANTAGEDIADKLKE